MIELFLKVLLIELFLKVHMETWSSILKQPVIHHVIKPATWGPSCWTFLHCIVMAYPLFPKEQDREAMKAYFHALKDVLPCYTCKEDFRAMLLEDPIEHHLHSREALCRWLNEKHNAVNIKTGAQTMSFEDSILNWSQPKTDFRLPRNVHGASAQSNTGNSQPALVKKEEEPCCQGSEKIVKFGVVMLVVLLGVAVFFSLRKQKT